jgi:SAM-dependent methyltransferase
MNNTPWFASWFDTPFYHILYKNRDDREAQVFMDNLLQHLSPEPDAHILDLACGKGRHSIYLASKGYQVTGIDLSAQSIEHASRFAHEQLDFFVHDMRHTFRENSFDYVFNLFTSFGYFNTEDENQQAINAMCENLKTGGILVIDFMNTFKVAANLREKETKTIDDITFHIKRFIKDKFIVKTIEFRHEKQNYQFEERVMGLTLGDFEKYFKAAGLTLLETFGNYNLDYYSKNSSERLILVATKK